MPNKNPDPVYLGIDYGRQRVGLATASAEAKLARPLTTIPPAQVPAFIQEHGPFLAVVLGLPRSLDGRDTPQTQAVRDFAATILEPLGIDPIYQDEAATSVLAEDHLRATGRPYRKEDIDAHAAAIILQDYLDRP